MMFMKRDESMQNLWALLLGRVLCAEGIVMVIGTNWWLIPSSYEDTILLH